jgi:glycosyl hydrolase family 62
MSSGHGAVTGRLRRAARCSALALAALGCHASGGPGAPAAVAGSCPFPTAFEWTSTGPLAEPQSPSQLSLKDFTVAKANGKFVVYATVFDTKSGWGSVNFNFADWSQAASAPQTFMGNTAVGATVAPTLFYFTPRQVWVLAYQSGGFKYATTNEPTQPSSWSPPRDLLKGGPPTALDQTVICDAAQCYLFFAGDNGSIYRSTLPSGDFPGTFSGYETILRDTQVNLYESVQVYSVTGTGQFLMLVEAVGLVGRYLRAFRASSLGGTFTAIPGASTEARPFAGQRNVTFTGTAWTKDISHGDLVRTDPSETQPIEPCHLQFLYQGVDRTKPLTDYATIPYRPALLTLTH